MQPLMKKPMYSGFGRRNNTPEALKVERALKLQSKLDAEILRKQKLQPAPMVPGHRALNYIAQTGARITPAQRRRAEKKSYRWLAREGATWLKPGPGVSTAIDESVDGDDLPEWDPTECSCHINPPCGYCEGGEYKEL
jgi:hypothetical protein